MNSFCESTDSSIISLLHVLYDTTMHFFLFVWNLHVRVRRLPFLGFDGFLFVWNLHVRVRGLPFLGFDGMLRFPIAQDPWCGTANHQNPCFENFFVQEKYL